MCGLFVALAALRLYAREHEQHLVQEYGQAMATMAANRAIDATLNHDLVSLQVILQDITDNPRALVASIKDVENHLLVQAGNTKALAQAVSPYTFQADIPLQDAVAGTVSVTLEGAMADARVLFYGVAGVSTLLMLMAVVSLAQMPAPLILRPVKPQRAALPQPEPQAPSSESAALFTAYLELRLVNLAVLQQQLSGDRIVQVLTRLEKSIVQILKLYPGRCRTAPTEGRAEGVYRLEFTRPHSPLEAQQAAIRFASLALALNQHSQFQWVMQAVVADTAQGVAQCALNHRPAGVYGVFEQGFSSYWDDVIFYQEAEGIVQCLGFVPPLDDDLLAQQEALEKRLG